MTPHSEPVAAPLPSQDLDAIAAELARVVARVDALERRLAVQAEPDAPVAPVPVPVVAPRAAVLPPLPGNAIGEVRAVLTTMFQLALLPPTHDDDEAERRFRGFSDLFHHSRKGSPLLENELMNYKWRPLCTRAAAYVRDTAVPGSFDIVQMTPEVVDERTPAIKVFLRAERRMPPPVTFRRDDLVEGAWRIESSSL